METDRVADAIRAHIAMRPTRSTRTGFITICCPSCTTRGETQDRKFRCGIRFSPNIGVNCFNCGMKTGWKIGTSLPYNLKKFLGDLGVPSMEVKKLTLWADVVKSMLGSRQDLQEKFNISVIPDF